MTDPQFISAIVGAIVGGLLALAAQEFNYRRLTARAEAALRLTALVKLIQMQANHGGVIKLLDEGAALSKSTGMTLAQATQAGLNESSPIELSPDEVAAILATGDAALFNVVVMVSTRHDTMIALQREHRRLRDAMTALSSAIPNERGIGSFALTGREAVDYLRLNYEAEVVIRAARTHCSEQVESLRWLIAVLNLSMKRLDDPRRSFEEKRKATAQPSL